MKMKRKVFALLMLLVNFTFAQQCFDIVSKQIDSLTQNYEVNEIVLPDSIVFKGIEVIENSDCKSIESVNYLKSCLFFLNQDFAETIHLLEGFGLGELKKIDFNQELGNENLYYRHASQMLIKSYLEEKQLDKAYLCFNRTEWNEWESTTIEMISMYSKRLKNYEFVSYLNNSICLMDDQQKMFYLQLISL